MKKRIQGPVLRRRRLRERRDRRSTFWPVVLISLTVLAILGFIFPEVIHVFAYIWLGIMLLAEPVGWAWQAWMDRRDPPAEPSDLSGRPPRVPP